MNSPNTLNTLKAVIKKEWRDSIRNRRSLSAALLFAVSGPLLIAFLISSEAEQSHSKEPVRIFLEGEGRAADLEAFLEDRRVEIVARKEMGDAEPTPLVGLQIPVDYRERFATGESVLVTVIADRSRASARREAERVEAVIRNYSASLGQLRLSLRGVSPSVANPVIVDSRDLSTRAARSSDVLGVLTIYFLLAAFIGSMAVSIDVAAGERERNSLEVLMAQPISAFAVFAGKTFVASAFGVFGIAFTIAASKLAFVRVPLEDIGLTWALGWADAGAMLLGLLPLAVLVAALQISLSLWAKTFKEASAYLNALILLPMATALFMQIKEVEAATWMYSVPLIGHQQMLRSMIRTETLEPALVGLLCISTLGCAAALMWAGSSMLGRERIVFGQID